MRKITLSSLLLLSTISFAGDIESVNKGKTITNNIDNTNSNIKNDIEEENNNSSEKITIMGTVKDVNGEPLIAASVFVEGTNIGTITNDRGEFVLEKVPSHKKRISASYLGYKKQTLRYVNPLDVNISLDGDENLLDEVEVFGNRHLKQEKLDYISRLPLRPNEQIQSISVISNKLIEHQGTLSLADAAKNVVGVSTFATYGGASESLSARGYRGIPTLKNGVRVNSDFRGQGFLTDMQGIESIQMIKGSAAITQGLASDLGSGGGVVNVATKTPKFINGGEVTLRYGSWNAVRPTFDIQHILDKNNKTAFRVNGAYEKSDNFRAYVEKERIYINPSFEWRPNDNSTLTFEMDYLHDKRTPDRGTVNLAADSINALYDLPNDKFLGFASDRVYTDNMTFSSRFVQRLNDNFSFNVGVFGSFLDTDNQGASNTVLKSAAKKGEYNIRTRNMNYATRKDNNTTVQMDLVGRDVYTGPIKHTFQVGADFRHTYTNTQSSSVLIDTINVLADVSNSLPAAINNTLKVNPATIAFDYSYGLMVQDVITFNKYIKTSLGARYSFGNSKSGDTKTNGNAWNPMVGVIISPIKNLNLFASYTTSTSLRSASNMQLINGVEVPVGPSVANQFETGIKSDWFDNRLRFNLTLFHINNSNLSYSIYDDDWNATGYYGKAGDLTRKGIETELTGRLFENMEVILGYAYLNAAYHNSPAYMEGSAPMNTPTHTANGWVNYHFKNTILNGMTIGLGAFYTGERPVTDYTLKATHANTQPGVKPFNMDAYTTVNAKVGYTINRVGLNLFFNNILNSTGYSSYYRGGYINPTDPFNFAAQAVYRF
ncbi:MAG: TonB-dependent receptor [Bacteroidales bacterium]|nr:TonB-dependent receptor [Bacteroidales bacterium]